MCVAVGGVGGGGTQNFNTYLTTVPLVSIWTCRNCQSERERERRGGWGGVRQTETNREAQTKKAARTRR